MKLLRIKSICILLLFIFVWAILISPLAAVGQTNNKVDSLLYKINNGKPDSTKVKRLLMLANRYLKKEELTPAEFKEVFKTIQQATTLCDSLGLDFGTFKSKVLFTSGNALVHSGDVEGGKKVFMLLAEKARNTGNKKEEANSWQGYADALMASDKLVPFSSEAIAAYTNASNLYLDAKDPKNSVAMFIEVGRVHGRLAELSLAEKAFLEAIPKSKACGNYMLPYIYCTLATANRYMGNYNKALEYAFDGLKWMNETKDTLYAGDNYGELAEVYEALEKPAESAVWYKKCIDKRESIPTYPLFALYRTYSLFVAQLIKAGAQKEALAIVTDLQKRRHPNTLGESAVFFQSIAYCYDANNIYDSTEKYYLKTVHSYQQAFNILHMADEIMLISFYDLAKFYVKHNQFTKAKPFLDTLAVKQGSLNVLTKEGLQFLLFKADSASGNYAMAIKHFQQYKSLTDSIFTDKKSKEIEELQIQYKTEKKDEEIGFLTKKDQLQQANLRQANIIKNWIMASAALLILLLAVGYNRYRFKQKTNSQLQEQQLVINQKNTSLLRLVDEKEWLMKEIHHRVKNNFHIVMGLLGTQSGYLKNEEAIAAMKESQQRINAMSLIHQKLYQSESLSAIDMTDYIHELVDYLKDSFNSNRIQFHFQLDRITLALSHVIPVGLILNEAITNVIKYAYPNNSYGNIYISFKHNSGNNKIVLTVKDDGIGLPAGFNSNSQSSMGINLIKGLSEDIDGTCSIQSNNGTSITVSFIYHPDTLNNFAPSVTPQNTTA